MHLYVLTKQKTVDEQIVSSLNAQNVIIQNDSASAEFCISIDRVYFF